MKKILIGIFALTLVSASSAFADTGKRAKKSKAKIVCTKSCPDRPGCHKAICPNKPGCVCN